MTMVRAVFAVVASNVQDVEIDTADMSPDDIAAELEVEASNPSVCHHCDDEISDPSLDELVGFTIEGVEYTPRNGKWVKA